jgi:hypothetical protein
LFQNQRKKLKKFFENRQSELQRQRQTAKKKGGHAGPPLLRFTKQAAGRRPY